MKAAPKHPIARKAVTDLVLEVFHLNGGLLTVGDWHAPDQLHRRAILALSTEAGESAYRAAMLN